jgi:4a-hydroxytetrahydrobiopterin dehydratase
MPGMDDLTGGDHQRLSRPQASEAVTGLGWRFVLGVLRTHVPVTSLPAAVDAAVLATTAAGAAADGHLRMDVRRDRLIVTLQTAAVAGVTTRDTDLAGTITAALAAAGLRTAPDTGGEPPRSAQLVEIGIDALDIPTIRPFWRAVLGYTDEPGPTGPADPLIDPLGQHPAIWFQQMDAPRPQRNRVHLDISVPHDEAPGRVAAALAAGGRLVTDRFAPAFWVLADPEGNEACVTTWQGRDG